MTKRRRLPNKTEKIAACLIEIKRGKEWLIPEPLRSTGTADEVVKFVQWHHLFPDSLDGDTRPQNITPLSEPDHECETAERTIPIIAKAKRIMAAQAEFRRVLLRKVGIDASPELRKHGKFRRPPDAKFDWRAGRYRRMEE